MWSSVKTHAVVLSSRAFREADRSYTALTPHFGKLAFVGRGALKPKAKLAAHLEPCAVVELEIVRGARSTTVINVERRVAFRRAETSLSHRLLTLSSLSLLDAITQTDAEDPLLYDALIAWLEFLDAQETLHPTRSTLLLGAFLLRIMAQLGYDTTLLHLLPKNEAAAALLHCARNDAYTALTQLPLKGVDVEAYATCVHDLLGYHVPGYADRPFWVGIIAG